MNETLQLLGYVELLAKLIAAGQTTVEKFKGFLKAEGVTDEEFDALKARHEAAIWRREREHDPTP